MASLSAYATRLGRWFRRPARHLKAMMELRSCSEKDIDKIARDVGVSEQDLMYLASHRGRDELMPQRLEALHLDPAYIEVAYPAAYRDLQRVCAYCADSARCARDLASGDVQAGMRDYCLNAHTIDALVAEREEALPKDTKQ
jgi:hypothetical protein